MNKAMMADAVATTTGAICGTSTVTTFVESSAGVAEGGRTGLTGVFIATLFLLSIFLLPLFAFIPIPTKIFSQKATKTPQNSI